jgi:Protein of unknown function (DUF1552)
MSGSKRGIQRIGRRLFLRGAAGAVVGLPLLESLFAKGASAQAMMHRYAIFVRQANGVQQAIGSQEPDRFWPTKLGALTSAGMTADGDQAVNVLSDFAAKLLIVRGCEMKQITDAGCGHSQGGLLCLTAARANGKNVEKALATGESIDNRIVRELEGPGKDPLTLRAGARSGYLDDVLSYRGSGDRRVAESNPYNAYKALFGLSTAGAGTDDKRGARRKSVNDLIRGEMARLLTSDKLSKDDRYRLEQHQQAIRDVEVAMACQLAPEQLTTLSKITTKQAESDANIVETARLQCQVIALAMSCGRARAVTLQIGNGNDQTQYTINGVKYERFHHISHRVNSDGSDGTPITNAVQKHHDVDKLFGGIFKTLLTHLSEYKTATGTLLDEGVSVWLNDLSTGPPHATRNMPYVCAGSCGGVLKQGVYVDAADVAANKYVTHNKFLNTIGAVLGCKNAAGGELDDFGDTSLAKGQIPQMKV